jgi:uncharacterized membrane protein
MAPRAKATRKREKSPSPWESLLRHGPAQIRFLIALAVGIAVALLAPFQDTIPRILVGWNAGGWLYLILIGIKMAQAEVEGIKREAGIERESRIAVLIIVVLGAVFAMLGLFIERRTIGLSIATIFLSWLLIHTVFAIYYAHEFHSEAGAGTRGGGGRGFRFPGDPTPDYLDFLYFSFVVGTTNQTSDTEITSRAMRRVVTIHGILSFFFNTAVIVLAINLAAQLVQG